MNKANILLVSYSGSFFVSPYFIHPIHSQLKALPSTLNLLRTSKSYSLKIQ